MHRAAHFERDCFMNYLVTLDPLYEKRWEGSRTSGCRATRLFTELCMVIALDQALLLHPLPSWLRYLDCPKGSFAWKLRQLLMDGSAAIDPAVGQFWHELIGDSPPCLSTEIQRAAYAILWMGLRGEREGLPPRVSFVMCFRRSVRLRGRVLGGKGLR